MIKINYPSNLKKFTDEYLKLFPVKEMKKSFNDICSNHKLASLKINKIEGIDNILIGDINSLCNLLQKYDECLSTNKLFDKRKEINDNFKEVFDYEMYYDSIVNFLIDFKDEVSLYTCHYCNIEYINPYGIRFPFNDKLDFLNNASDEQLRYYIKGDIADSTIEKIKNGRDYLAIEEFNKLSVWKKDNKANDIRNDNKNHFFLDHYISQSYSSIFSLSLYNFIPCCANCNSRMKGAALISNDYEELKKLSPTCDEYSFESEVKLTLQEKELLDIINYQNHMDNYYLHFSLPDNSIYKKEIQSFNLTERYNYHAIEAVYLTYLMKKYSESQTLEFAKLLGGKSQSINDTSILAKAIRNDILGNDLMNYSRSFSKLRKDILERDGGD